MRRLVDCLVAVPMIEAGATLLQVAESYERVARHTPLQLDPVR